MHRFIAVNEQGRRVGDSHHNAKLTDHEVELLRQLHREKAMGYKKLAAKFECSVALAAKICQGRRRGQVVAQWRRVYVSG